MQVEAARRDLAASEARSQAYKEQIDSLKQTASDARAAAQETRFGAWAVLAIMPMLLLVVLAVQAVKNSQENRNKIRRSLEADLLPGIKDDARALVSRTLADLEEETEEVRAYLDRVVGEVKRDRVATLDGLRLFFYRQAYDFRSRGAWGRAMMFTVYALAAEYEAAELTGEEARLRYARVAMANHGTHLIDHVVDFARESDQAWWDSRDLDQLRYLKRHASGDLVPTLTLMEQHTLNSLERIRTGAEPAA